MSEATKRRIEVLAGSTAKKPRLEVQHTLYLKNLNDQINRDLLKHNLYLLFSTYGAVISILLNPKLRGQAHVVFETTQAASVALKAMQNVVVFGKEMRIEFSKTKSKCIEDAENALAEEED